MSDQNGDAGKVLVPELPPHALVEATDSIVRIGGALAVGYSIEEVTVVCPLPPHALHLRRTGLEIAEVLLSQPGLFVELDLGPAEGGGAILEGGRQGLEDALGGLAGAAVGGGEDLEGVVGAEELSQSQTGLGCLGG